MRYIARLDIKDSFVVKGFQFEGLRKIAPALDLIPKYISQGCHEIFLSDVMASLYNRNRLHSIIKEITSKCFVPVIAGGGIRSLEDARSLISLGADKVAVNSNIFTNPELLQTLSETFGSQAVVVSLQCRWNYSSKDYFLMKDAGREFSSFTLSEWLTVLDAYPFGELLITSIDKDGTCMGIDEHLLEYFYKNKPRNFNHPIIYSGGINKLSDLRTPVLSGISACAIGTALHKELIDLSTISTLSNSSSNKEYSLTHNFKSAVIVDLGLGNLCSLSNLLSILGLSVSITKDPKTIETASLVFLPGVGHFTQAVASLEQLKLRKILVKRHENGAPMIGICLGMHLLFKSSKECSGFHSGLNIFSDTVNVLHTSDETELPNVGWRKVVSQGSLYGNSEFYFIHSFGVTQIRNKNELDDFGVTTHGKSIFYSYVRKKKTIGLQFHPERSGGAGIELINKILTSIS